MQLTEIHTHVPSNPDDCRDPSVARTVDFLGMHCLLPSSDIMETLGPESSRLTDGGVEAQRGKTAAQGHTAMSG